MRFLTTIALFCFFTSLTFAGLDLAAPRGASAATLPSLPSLGSDLDGVWEGLFQAGDDMAVRFTIASAGNKTTIAVDILNQDARDIPVTAATRNGAQLRFDVGAIDGAFEGTLATDGLTINGTWLQLGKRIPLTVKRQIGQGSAPAP